jgi:hypothetical protein
MRLLAPEGAILHLVVRISDKKIRGTLEKLGSD